MAASRGSSGATTEAGHSPFFPESILILRARSGSFIYDIGTMGFGRSEQGAGAKLSCPFQFLLVYRIGRHLADTFVRLGRCGRPRRAGGGSHFTEEV